MMSSLSIPGALPEASCHEEVGASCLPFLVLGSPATSADSLASCTTDQAAGDAAATAGWAGSAGATGGGAGVHTSSTGGGVKAGSGASGAIGTCGVSNWVGAGAVVPISHGEGEGMSLTSLLTGGGAAGGGS